MLKIASDLDKFREGSASFRLSGQKLLLGALLLINLGAGGCQRDNPSLPLLEETSSSPIEAERNPTEVVTVALVMKTLTNPFFIEMEKGARRAEQELGIALMVKTAAQETSIEQQINIIEQLIRNQVDAIVIAPGDSTELIPVLEEAQDVGITIINIDNRLDPSRSAELGLSDVPFISVDNSQGAYLSAKYISDQIKAPTQVAILEGIQTAQNAIDRKQGAQRAFQENPNLTVVAETSANWKIDEAYEAARQIWREHPDIEAIFCANDMMALGVLQYLSETQRSQVLVAGFDALEEAKAAIRTGRMAVTIDQQAAEQGYLGVHYAVQAMAGKRLPAETVVDVEVITRETLP
ncbi:sugar ABC transporter substrate-binding protein [Pseudanabaena sp. FACHB-2040]|uniref:sugar ABC transporter substrate-binding protein n=1 Tax=Pseudanabaena sp. FACHB-2040 TaxID=2692859 RepID=UPI0016825F97|nr:sugar ABC transporter substrate-binding protein [Pseudanabaena sp. FACHB-2040]MBD2257068.1 sugar ABC transporter substrate-binding protein [Pseudanabaena sp. FACHB-2040]